MKVYDKIVQFVIIVCIIPISSSSPKPSSGKNETENIEINTVKEETSPTTIILETSPGNSPSTVTENTSTEQYESISSEATASNISQENVYTSSEENVSNSSEENASNSSEENASNSSEEYVVSSEETASNSSEEYVVSSEENASNSSEEYVISSEENASNSSEEYVISSEENASSSSEENASNSSEESASNSSEENASNSSEEYTVSSEENASNSSEEYIVSSEENSSNSSEEYVVSSEENEPLSSEENESISSEESVLIDAPNYGLFSEEYQPFTSKRNTSTDTPTELSENETSENSDEYYDFDSRGENESQSENETDVNVNGTLIPIDPDLLAFYLYPRKDNNSYCEEIIYGDRSSLERSSFNSSNPVVFIIHGFISNYTTKFTQSVKNAYLQYGIVEKENVIAVDWGKLSTSNNYTHTEGTVPNQRDLAHDMYYQAAVGNVPIAGKRIAEFISFLSTEGYISGPQDAHLIGFSLGAHVGGATGMTFRQQNQTLLKRITGADPAGPIYQKERDPDKMLDPTDATFVDVIHTNQGQDGYYGNEGHADFMINGGGPNQPGCQNVAGSTIPDSMSGICAHNKSWQLYIRSLVETFYGCKCPMGNGAPDFALCRTLCPQKVVFGHKCPPSARGSYYVETN